jgi:hypothetical protein
MTKQRLAELAEVVAIKEADLRFARRHGHSFTDRGMYRAELDLAKVDYKHALKEAERDGGVLDEEAAG